MFFESKVLLMTSRFFLPQEALEGYRACMMATNSNPEEVRKRAMADPEVQTILRDPAMRMILEQMQNDPKALQE